MTLILENVQSARRAPANYACPQCKQTIERETQCKKATALESGAKVSEVYMHIECHKAWAEYEKIVAALFPANDAGWLCDMHEVFHAWLLTSHAIVYEKIFGKLDAVAAPEVAQTALIASQDIKKGSVIGVYRPQEAGWVHLGDKWLSPDGMVIERAHDIPFVCAAV